MTLRALACTNQTVTNTTGWAKMKAVSKTGAKAGCTELRISRAMVGKSTRQKTGAKDAATYAAKLALAKPLRCSGTTATMTVTHNRELNAICK
eukprot:CAMPEP_0115381060 /NCGR_PEP_ID=MMETSP0271-20121206/5370_1 /TAXON_ID=71861 /ORGANISM="Scrippsiella trochoidea, Strain CCMP3099" /LENGTH=92 /DNA_ID=CAMNT_0002804317 /DNA_START=55 /DNA_END=333 /DNA_ORIENTATION=-